MTNIISDLKVNNPVYILFKMDSSQKDIKAMGLQEYANMMVKELHRVKNTLPHLQVEEIGAIIEQVKINLAMSRRLFDMLTLEHTNRLNTKLYNHDKTNLPYLDSINELKEIKQE